MRVLNVHNRRLEHIHPHGDSPPKYAILSHRWEKDIRDEVLFEDLINSTSNDDISKTLEKKRGYAKVVGACIQALKFGFDHVWIDSCCINQASSAELSESINSMYRCASPNACYAT